LRGAGQWGAGRGPHGRGAVDEETSVELAAGSIGGLFFNFTASKLVVFRRARAPAI